MGMAHKSVEEYSSTRGAALRDCLSMAQRSSDEAGPWTTSRDSSEGALTLQSVGTGGQGRQPWPW